MDEVLRLDLDRALVIIRGRNILEVDKYDYSKHPESKRLRPSKASAHVPEWRKKAKEAAAVPAASVKDSPAAPAQEVLNPQQAEKPKNHRKKNADAKIGAGRKSEALLMLNSGRPVKHAKSAAPQGIKKPPRSLPPPEKPPGADGNADKSEEPTPNLLSPKSDEPVESVVFRTDQTDENGQHILTVTKNSILVKSKKEE